MYIILRRSLLIFLSSDFFLISTLYSLKVSIGTFFRFHIISIEKINVRSITLKMSQIHLFNPFFTLRILSKDLFYLLHLTFICRNFIRFGMFNEFKLYLQQSIN